jgi:hypothetical protein
MDKTMISGGRSAVIGFSRKPAKEYAPIVQATLTTLTAIGISTPETRLNVIVSIVASTIIDSGTRNVLSLRMNSATSCFWTAIPERWSSASPVRRAIIPLSSSITPVPDVSAPALSSTSIVIPAVRRSREMSKLASFGLSSNAERIRRGTPGTLKGRGTKGSFSTPTVPFTAWRAFVRL